MSSVPELGGELMERRRTLESEGEKKMSIIDGTFTGDGTNVQTITLDFEPDFIYIVRESQDSTETPCINGIVIMRDMYASATYINQNSTSILNGGHIYNINGLYGSVQINADYSDGVLTINASPVARRFLKDGLYKYRIGVFEK